MEMNDMKFNLITEKLIDMALAKGPGLVLALLTLIIGWWAIGVASRLIRRALRRSNRDVSSLSDFIARFASIALKVMLIMSVASMIGIETTSFLALLGAAGLALGLALQGSLSNFAGGLLIIIFKPYKVNDFIDCAGGSGFVKSIDILHTVLLTPDNKTVVIPNGMISNGPVTNYSLMETRRVDFSVGISYGSNIEKARDVILETFRSDSRTLAEPAPMIVLTNLGDSSLDLSARAWVNTPDYWPYYWENLEKIKVNLDANGIVIPFPQRDVHMIKQID